MSGELNRNTWGVEKIIAEINRYEELTHSNIKEICELLMLLKEKGGGHSLFVHPMFKHYRLVATGKLLPALLFKMELKKEIVERIAAQRRETQQAIVDGYDFPVAHWRESTASFIEERQTLPRMATATLMRVFLPTGEVATPTDQKKAIKEELAVKAAQEVEPRVKADVSRGTILVANHPATLDELREALADLGYVIQKKPQRKVA